MNLIQFHIDWKYYVRNRMLEVLRRAGANRVFEMYPMGDERVSPAELVRELDKTQRSFLNSIEKYALDVPEAKQIFIPGDDRLLPVDQGSDAFCKRLHEHFIQMMDFLSGLAEEDLLCPLEQPHVTSRLDIGWIIQFTTLYEQSVTSRIISLFHFNGVRIRAPWATARFMKPVKLLVLR